MHGGAAGISGCSHGFAGGFGRKARGVFLETLYKSDKACYNVIWIYGTPERVSTQNKGERRKECAVYTATARRARFEVQPILVVKNDGTRQAFDVSKIKRGIIKACEKRPVPIEKIDALADDITKKLYNSMAQEVSSKQIGEMVMEGLKELDEVAYVRYASVYRSFKDISSFMRELQQMMEYKAEEEQKGEKRAEKT